MEIGALRLEVIKLRVALQQAAQDVETKLRAKDREIANLQTALEQLRTSPSVKPDVVIDEVAVEKTATNGAAAH